MIKFKRRYHFVPYCPKCGSKKTGRYVYMSNSRLSIEKYIASCLAKGEIVKPISALDTTKQENAFCLDCGCEWNAIIDTIWFTPEQIEKHRTQRGISSKQYKDVINIKKTVKKKLKEEKKKKKLEKKSLKKKVRKLKPTTQPKTKT